MQIIDGLNIEKHSASERLLDIKIKNKFLDKVKEQFDNHDLLDI